jgi:hypothetical protein
VPFHGVANTLKAPFMVSSSGKCSGADCVPSIAADGDDIALRAGKGTFTFDTATCGVVDACALAAAVEAATDALGNL